MALQEHLAHFRPGIASAQYHLNDLAIWASSGDGDTEIRHVTIIITDAERTRIMPTPIIEGTWLTGADAPTIYVNATTLQRYWPQAWDPNRLSCFGHQSHTAATRAGVAMNQKPF